jgi:protein-S-isoprenylcysteine O-methyltransferase Ste14
MDTKGPRPARPRFGREGEHPWGDLGQLLLLALFLAVWILDSFVYGFSILRTSILLLVFRLVIAGGLFLGAFVLAHKGHLAVSDEVRREGRLIREGPFVRVRHPLYLAAILFYVSLVTSTLSLASAALLGGILAFYDAIATYEEGFLMRKHGGAYRVYKQKVPKWIPRLRAGELE